MSSVSFPLLKNDTNTVIYEIPSGKLEMTTGEKRIKSTASQGSCFYVAMERIFFHTKSASIPYANEVNPFAKNLQDMLQKKDVGQFSMLLEQLEKQLTSLESGYPFLFSQSVCEVYKMVGKEQVTYLLNIHDQVATSLGKEMLVSLETDEVSFKARFPQKKLLEFQASTYPNFYDFLHNQYFSAKLTLYEDFLKKICTPLAVHFFTEIKDELSGKVGQIQNAVQALIATKYGFKTSTWNKSQTIEDLFKAIREHGPMLIPGKFGRSYYKVDSIDCTDLPGKAVSEWTQDAERATISRSHVVILVGVSKEKGTLENDGGHVYFLDPNDPSDPTLSQNDKIYKISYRSLKMYLETFGMMKGQAIYPSGLIP